MVREELTARKDLRLIIYRLWPATIKQNPLLEDLASLVLTCLLPFQSLNQGIQVTMGDSELDLLLQELKMRLLQDLHQLVSWLANKQKQSK